MGVLVIFLMSIRFQLIAVMVYLILCTDFIRRPHLKLLSTKFYIYLMAALGFNLLFDVTTVYTITHRTETSEFLNRLFHQFFIASVIIVLFMNFMYVMILSSEQKRLKKVHLFIVMIPLFIAILEVMFGTLYYHVDERGVYSYGPMVYAVYICGVIYLLGVLVMGINKKNCLTSDQRSSLVASILIWGIILGIQIAVPNLLLSGLGMTLMLLTIYLSFENQSEHIDVETGGFNRSAFHRMMSERYEHGKNFYVVTLTIENFDHINSVAGHDEGNIILREIKDLMKEYSNEDAFHSRSNCFSLFMFQFGDTEIEKLEMLLKSIHIKISDKVDMQCHMDIIEVFKYTKSKDEVYELMNFMSHQKYHIAGKIVVLDEVLVAKKHRMDKIEKRVVEALQTDAFEMYYQPIF